MLINRVKNTKWVASSAVEHSAFNRLVLGSNPRRPISLEYIIRQSGFFRDQFSIENGVAELRDET
jgi:hypothetical protein